MLLENFEFKKIAEYYYYDISDNIFSLVFYNKKIDTVIIVDYNIFQLNNKKEVFSYREYTNYQNELMKKYKYVYRFLDIDLDKNQEIIIKILNKELEIPVSSLKEIIRNNGDASFLEHHFEKVFLKTYGENSYVYLRKEEKVIGFNSENIYIDYVIEKKDIKIAIEENGENYHHPQKIGYERHKKQIMRQNAVVYQGYKVFRFSIDEIRFEDRMVDEMLSYFGSSNEFIKRNIIYEDRKFELYDHQKDAIIHLENIREKGIESSVIVLPTGTGKSVIGEIDIKKYVKKKKDAKVAIIVPSINLKSQWINNFKDENSKLSVGENLENQIYVSTYIGISNKKNILSQEYFDYILVDEAHHSCAPELIKTLRYFKPKFLLGMTATPDRLDKAKLEDLYSKVERNLELKEAIEKGLLSPIRVFRLESNINLSEVRFNGKNYINSDLEKTIVVDSRNILIADTVKKYFGTDDSIGKKQGIIFCVSVKHAEKIEKLLVERGIEAKTVSGKEKKSNEYLEQYKKGKIQFLCSCSLINEGWDAPETSVLVMARPTMSKILYYQQLGRGTRKTLGKEALYVIDVVDNYGYTNIPWSTNAIFNNPAYIPFGDVITSKRDFSGELSNIELLEREKKLQEIDIFTFEKKYEGYITTEELARELFISTSSLKNWIKNGEVTPDYEGKIGNIPYYLFDIKKINEIREKKGLKIRNQETIYDDFWEFIQNKDYTLSYKIVLMLSILKHLKNDGEANFNNVKNTYAEYYKNRILENLTVDRKSCKYDLEFLENEKMLFSNILTNPFEKFERKRFLLHSDDKSNIGFNYYLWEKITALPNGKEDFIKKLKNEMLNDLKNYYKDLGGEGNINCFS